ncbi:MAG: acyl-CoA dehydrogenase family protein [Acidimicrobiia bacterium]
MTATHTVENQVELRAGVNAYTEDPLVVELVGAAAPWATGRCQALGAVVGDPATMELARLANRHHPELRTHDPVGRRLDRVEFHPAYHDLMGMAFGHGVHALSWTAGLPGAHVARAALSYLWNQAENGTGCPTGMAYAAVPALREEAVLEPWLEKVTAFGYDPRHLPMAGKEAVTIGYGMTEKQGGSDLRANQTRAVPVGKRGPGQEYLVTGHKWFFSAPMSDGFFVLAAAEAGVSCFFLPRLLEDGTPNRLHFQRLKDKCGNRSNASSEVEFSEAWGVLVGEEGRGIATALTSADYTRLDFAVGSAGLQRRAIALALHHTEQRQAFGKPLAEHDSMRRMLADLILEWEAGTRLAFRVAAAADSEEESEHLVLRLLTPVAKFWNCKRVSPVVEEALECIGGNAYVEEHPMARLYREAPLNSVWEGTANMMVMDVERTLDRRPEALAAVLDEVRPTAGAHPEIARSLGLLDGVAAGGPRPNGRAVTTLLALTVQASLLARHSPPAVTDAFCQARLGEAPMPGFGVAELTPAQMDTVVGRFFRR